MSVPTAHVSIRFSSTGALSLTSLSLPLAFRSEAAVRELESILLADIMEITVSIVYLKSRFLPEPCLETGDETQKITY